MSRFGRDESGFTLIEMLVSASLMIVVLSATLSILDGIWGNTRNNERQNEQIDRVRQTSSQMLRQVRNLANPNPAACGTPPAGYTVCPTIDTAGDSDFIFQTTDPAKQWVRYCLSNTNSGGVNSTTQDGTIWYQQAAAPVNSVTAGMRTNCPSTAVQWNVTKIAGRNVSNSAQSGRPLFTFDQPTSNPAYLTAIRRVRLSVYVDLDPAKRPAEAQVASEAFMRNQNQPPVANFDMLTGASPTAYTLDGSGSTDPEGRNLVYDWYRTPNDPATSQIPTDANTQLPDCREDPTDSVDINGLTWTCMGNGVVLSHDFAGHTGAKVWLRVVDPGALPDLSNLPTSGVCPLRTSPSRTDDQCETF